MGLIVQKYGGSSVADAEGLKRVANRIVATKKAGHQVAVVVLEHPKPPGVVALTAGAAQHVQDRFQAAHQAVTVMPSPVREPDHKLNRHPLPGEGGRTSQINYAWG